MLIGSATEAIHFLAWGLFIPLALLLNLSWLRKKTISSKALHFFRKVMPEMSTTEQEAIDAGTTWWEAELFSGAPHWKALHHYPQARLTEREQKFLDGPVEHLCDMLNEFEICHQLADLPPKVWEYLKKEKFFAMIIPKKYGGLEFSPYAQSLILQKVTGISSVASSTIGVPNSLGPGELLQHYGTEEQKEYYLPRLAEGKEIPCFALTSPEAGSDAGSIPDMGVVCRGQWEGKDVLGMKLTWNKRYITLAPIATLLGLAFKLYDPDNLLGDKKELGITCALVPTNLKGIEIGRRHLPLACTFQNGPTSATELFLPLDYIIGGQKMAGQGWRMLMECLSVGRGITLPSNAAGGIRFAALTSGAYARIRRQFRIPIGAQEGIEKPLARLGSDAYLSKAASALTTTGLGLGEKPAIVSAIVKYHLTQKMRDRLIDSMDILGGKGICLGPNNYVGLGYSGSPIAVTVEGANILTRNMIIYGQGAIRCHPFLLDEINAAASDAPDALDKFDRALFGHIGFTMHNKLKSFWLGLTRSKLTLAPYNDETKIYYQQMTRLSSNLAFLSDTCMAVFGGQLKRKENLSARLGDILSHLYLASAVLKQFEDDHRPHEDMVIVQHAVEDNLYRAQQAIMDLIANLPQRWLRIGLNFIIFPTGTTLKAPSDKLEHQIAQLLQSPNATRQRLGENLYIKETQAHAAGRQEIALRKILAVEPLYQKVCDATKKRLPFMFLDKVAQQGKQLGVLDAQEIKALEEAEKYRLETINVDDFDPSELARYTEKKSVKVA